LAGLIIGIILGILGIIATVYFGIKALKPKVSLELQRDIVKIRAELHQVALYLDGLPKTKDKDKKALFEKGISLMAQYKYEEAIKSFRERLALETEGSAKSALLHLIGNSFYAWNKWNQALSSWEEALHAAEKANDEQGQAAALGNLGLSYRVKGEWDKAIEFHNKDLEISKKIGDEHGIAQTKGNIAVLYKRQGKKEEAKKIFEEILELFEKIGDKPNVERTREHLEDL
jgi:tetratricopeptide (TPR) repeat protein